METSEEWVVYRMRFGVDYWAVGALPRDKWDARASAREVELIADGLTEEQAANFVRLAEESNDE